MTVLDDVTPETFDYVNYLAELTAGLDKSLTFTTTAGRRALTKNDPLAFALVYLRHHLSSEETGGQVTISAFHQAICRAALQWRHRSREPRQARDAWVAPRGSGKALALDTPVLTANRGWVTHGDLKVGDRVFDENGKPCNVVALSPIWQDRPCYRITFSDGEQIIADAAHEWPVKDRYRDRQDSVTKTETIARKWLLTESRGSREVRYSIDVAGPLQYPGRQFDIAPYTLGVWLGDGHSDGGRVTVSDEDLPNLLEQLTAEGENPVSKRYPSTKSSAYYVHLAKPRPHLCPREHELTTHGAAGGRTYGPCRVCIADWQRANYGNHTLAPATNRNLVSRLADLDLIKNKHIPEDYFTVSADQRLALLQGLMDTDGTISRSGTCAFTGTNERLCHDVLRLIRGLGIKARITEGRARINGVDKGPQWRINFTTSLPVFRLPRKLARVKSSVKAAGTRQIVDVEQVENQATSCITVDSPSHLYLAGRTHVPTHNSTWGFLLLPLWALAHGWRTFVIAFADSGTQAELHLMSFKHELDTNELLRRDYPELCNPATRPATGGTVADRTGIYIAKSGAAFVARGIDSSTLGVKIENRRPDLILFDDIEPDESNYSLYQKEKRLSTVVDAVFPMNLYAVVWFLGTTVMLGSIIDDLVLQATENKDPPKWPREENIRVHYFPAILTRDDGTEESLWPALWALTFLQSIRHTAAYAKNFANRPAGKDGVYWTLADFPIGRLEAPTRVGLWVDPAVTSKTTSDYTGLAVVAYSASEKRCEIRDAFGVKLGGRDLRRRVLGLLEEHPDITRVFVEVNQGGDLWLDVFHDLAVKVVTHNADESKETRFARGLNYWQRGRVLHWRYLEQLVTQATAFPRGSNDDVPDAAVAGVLHFLHPPARIRSGVSAASYV